MVEWDFIADSALDAIVNSEALVLADSLPPSVPGRWQTELDLQIAVDKYMNDKSSREKSASEQRDLLSDLIDYDELAERFLECA